jgi:hypothetical protein
MNAQILSRDVVRATEQRGRNLAYLTIGWNSVEAVIGW